MRVGIIGCGNQGKSHLKSLTSLKDAQIAYVCDIDQERLAMGVEMSGGAKPVSDFRQILDDPSIDGVTIATPDHWHTPIALLALDAGKHVYVEKPCCHNIREGQLLREAAQDERQGGRARHAVSFQSGDSASDRNAARRHHRRRAAGPLLELAGAQEYWPHEAERAAQQVDYDTWVGPAEMMPFQANRFHYDWHWWYNFGCGDLGNDGIHEFDYALWGLGVTTHPSIICGAGGKYFFDDDQQFPDTQQITFEYPGDDKVGDRKMLIYEMRLWSTTYPYNVDSGAEFFGTKGKMFISKRGKFEVRGERNAAARREARRRAEGRSFAESAELARLHQIRQRAQRQYGSGRSHRNGRSPGQHCDALAADDPLRSDSEKIVGDDEASALMTRKYRDGGYWGIPKNV